MRGTCETNGLVTCPGDCLVKGSGKKVDGVVKFQTVKKTWCAVCGTPAQHSAAGFKMVASCRMTFWCLVQRIDGGLPVFHTKCVTLLL